MPDRTFPDPYARERGTTRDPSSEADRRAARSMRQPGGSRTSVRPAAPGAHQPRTGGGAQS